MNDQTIAPENDKALTEKEVAKRWGVTVRTLYNWRRKSEGPRFFGIGKNIKYMLSEVVKFEQNNMRDGGLKRESELPEGASAKGVEARNNKGRAQ